MPDDFLITPGNDMDPGDIFLDVIFPNMKWPAEHLRPNLKQKGNMGVPYYPANQVELKPGDLLKVGASRRMIMMISDGCEIERLLKHHKGSIHKRHWLAAPLEKAALLGEAKQIERLRNGTQPNKFHIPADARLGGEELYVDLRRITPINCAYFLDGDDHKSRAVYSLSPKFKSDLKAKLVEFFTGLAIVSIFECPGCHEAIETKDLLIPYEAEDDGGPAPLD